MDELFGLSMNWIMVGLLAILLPSLALIGVMGWRNPVMLKMGLRNIPRRRAQTALIIVGIMISTLIMAAAFGTGDTINFSIRSQAVDALGPIDEIIVSARTSSTDSFGSNPYFPYSRFQQLQMQFQSFEDIDGMAAGIGEEVPAVNLRNFRSEGRMRVAGVDPGSLDQLGSIWSVSGEEVDLLGMAPDEVYLNQKAASELDAQAGDRLRLVVAGEPITVRVKEVVARGGLAGDQSTVIIPLDRAQAMFDRAGQVNSIVVSNRGGDFEGAKLSDEVTLRLRVFFADRDIVSRLQATLDQGEALAAIEARGKTLDGRLGKDVSRLPVYLESDEVSDQLIGLLADEDVSEEVVEALKRSGLDGLAAETGTLFADLGEFRVIDIKRRVLDQADEAASQVTAIFIVMGLFSILVGVLLIFLIFVMLAAARRPEMGMARAVGAKRIHLVQMFVFEGTAYAIVSAAVGVLAGLGVSALIILVANRSIETFEEDLQFTQHFEMRSIVVAYSLGMVITLATVFVSAYRVSRMNIVVAIRGLPESLGSRPEEGLPARLTGVGTAVIRPAIFGYRALASLRHGRGGTFFLSAFLTVLWIVVFPVWLMDILMASLRLAWPSLRQGWLTFVFGVLITRVGMDTDEAAPFRIGVSLAILGLGLMVRSGLRRTRLQPDSRDRLAFTITGLVLVAFWLFPFSSLRAGPTGKADAPPPASQSLYPGSVMSYRQWADPRGTLDLGQDPLLDGFAPIASLGQPSFSGDIGRADRIIIPALDINASVQDLAIRDLGDSASYETPRLTVGHIPGTPNPGSHGNGWYFGHLESPIQQEGNVFGRLPRIPDLLRDGEDVFVIAQSGDMQYLYQVTETDVLHQDDLSLYQAGDARITLVTCQPRGTYDHRLLVTAKLVGFREVSQPVPGPAIS